MRRFAGRAGNLPLRSMTPEIIKEIIVKRSGGLRNQGNDRRAIGRFFYWCMESPRKWVATNPVSEVRIAKPEHAVPEVYTVREVMRWLVAARRHRGGKFLSFIVLQFFGGLRPSEAMRLEPNQWNLVDAELSIRAQQTKTKRPRTTHLTPMAVEWLRVCPAARIYNNITSVEHWSELCKLARPRRVIPDGFRHTAISHYFRRTGSYGLTAEWADNTEKIIKDHYKGRVTSADSERFWCLYPTRQMRLHARNNSGKNGS
jgi:integrase